MKVVHVCLCSVVTDGWSYQDNLLPKYHRRNGAEVSLITSHFVWNEKGKEDIDPRSEYVNGDDVKIIRLDTSAKSVNDRLKTFPDFYKTLEAEKPDVIFLHGFHCVDTAQVVRYAKRHPKVVIYVDNHADYSNSATNWLSKNVLHRILWRHYAQMIRPYAKRFYGVLPARVKMLQELYGIPPEHTDLLVMGADDDLLTGIYGDENVSDLRDEYGIVDSDFLIVTGGKIDMAKRQTLYLMEAVSKLNRSDVKLLVFGSVVPDLKEQFDTLCGENVIYVGWQSVQSLTRILDAADLAVFSGRHSVIWEQTVAQGKPMVVRYWDGTTHIDIGGNVQYLYEDSVEETVKVLENILSGDTYVTMLKAAQGEKKNQFLYSQIARYSIRDVL